MKTGGSMKNINKGSTSAAPKSAPHNSNTGASTKVRPAAAGNQGTLGPISNKNQFPNGIG